MKSEEKGKQANHSKSLEKSTWKTVRQDWPKLLKVPRDSSASSVKRPPKICIPSKAKMKIKRMSRTKRALMEAMELTKLLTRLPMEAQYLEERVQPYWGKVQERGVWGGGGGGLDRNCVCLP